MKSLRYSFTFALLALALTSTGCRRSSDEVYRDTQSAGRHVKRGVNTLGGKHGESRQVRDGAEFAGGSNAEDDFVPLDGEQKQNFAISDQDQNAQAKETPGELGSSIPGIEAFKDPADDPALAQIFQHLHFDYNSSLIKSDEDLTTTAKIADYLKSHPSVYIFVEGHCDKRGPAAFNFALGANRSNAVRNVLIKEGVDPDHIFTVSYGKEKPLVEGDDEEFYRLNRRAQFRIYEK
jgi:peptidoglycan-associated lipoprotein